MDQNTIESLKGKSREERLEYLKNIKNETMHLSEHDLESINGGEGINPNSSGFYNGNYFTSWGYICESERGSIHC